MLELVSKLIKNTTNDFCKKSRLNNISIEEHIKFDLNFCGLFWKTTLEKLMVLKLSSSIEGKEFL